MRRVPPLVSRQTRSVVVGVEEGLDVLVVLEADGLVDVGRGLGVGEVGGVEAVGDAEDGDEGGAEAEGQADRQNADHGIDRAGGLACSLGRSVG